MNFARFRLNLTVFSSLLLLCSLSYAQAPESAKQSDVRVIIDISGSMKKNDPQNLRRPALEMLVNLLPDNSRGGVWTFGQYVNMLVKHGAIDSQWKQQATTKAQTINSIAQFTNIGEALEKAAYDKGYSSKDDFQTHIILLTDGMVDIDRSPEKNVAERKRILDEVLPLYQQAGYKIHTISLSDNADKQLMDRLALGTDGQSIVAKSADELMNVFLQVFDQAVPKEELPLSGNSFLTDSSIEEFTALIFRKPGTKPAELIAPDQEKYTQSTKDPNVNWHATDQYDLITVKRPLEGEWRINAELEPKSRVTVVSDLSLAVKPISTNLLQNETVDLSLALREENKVVNRAEFLKILDIDVKVSHQEKGKIFEQRLSDGLVPGNGVYTTQLDQFAELGDYEISVKVDGKTFQREFKHKASVRQPFAIDKTTVSENGNTYFKVTVSPQLQSIDFNATEVVGKLKGPVGSSNIVKFDFTEQQTWEWQYQPVEEGQYQLALRITQKNKTPKDFIPKPVKFSFPEDDNFFSDLDEPEPEPEPVALPPQPLDALDKEPEPLDEAQEDALADAEEEAQKGYMQWVLYGVLGLVNILIIFVIYLLYRKLFGRKSAADEDDDEAGEEGDASSADKSSIADQAMEEFDEPPMDEMNINDLDDEEEIDLSEDSVGDGDLDEMLNAEEEDPLAELTPEALDDDDEEPEFSLDDFAPDALDEEDK